MDEIIEFLRRIAAGPELPDDVVLLSAPPIGLSGSGIASLPATARSIGSIARRAPDLVRWLASGKVLKQGGSTWNRLTQGLTSAQKRMVAENPQMFRNYFRSVRQPNEAVRVGQGTGPGTALVRRPPVEVSRTTGTSVGPRAQTSMSPTTGTSVVVRNPMAAAQMAPRGIASIPAAAGTGAASGSMGRNLLPWLIGGGAGALALDQIFGGEEAPVAPEASPIRGQAQPPLPVEVSPSPSPIPRPRPVVERMRDLMPTTLVENTRRADMGVPVQDIVMAELRRKPEMRRQFVKSHTPGVMGTWQDLPYELRPATTLSEREIRRMIEASR